MYRTHERLTAKRSVTGNATDEHTMRFLDRPQPCLVQVRRVFPLFHSEHVAINTNRFSHISPDVFYQWAVPRIDSRKTPSSEDFPLGGTYKSRVARNVV